MKKINKNSSILPGLWSLILKISSECNFVDFSSIGKKEIEFFFSESEHDEAFTILLLNEINFFSPLSEHQ
jgi:hypothetical protein